MKRVHSNLRGWGFSGVVSAWAVLAVGCLSLVPALAGNLDEKAAGQSSASAEAGKTVEFHRDIWPVLERRCVDCHGAEKQRSGLRLDLRAAALKGGDSGAAILPGRGTESPLVRLISGLDAERVMPPKGERLTHDEISLIRVWIEEGATWPDTDGIAGDHEEEHWAFQPVNRPQVPVVDLKGAGSKRWGCSAIDDFIGARLEGIGLRPSPEADRVSLIRRLYLVMLGIPPTPEEVASAVGDPRPDWWESWVDRVLRDPRYGERWARHWLDVVRFAQSNGFETNRERLSAWRYRDYVIDAFNGDLPYDQFIREQIAGDLYGVDVATGFLVGGPVDIVGSPDPALTAQQRADELDDMVNTTGTAFLGLTLGCARCHSHKFDPIEQREYYALSAVFAGVRHGERPQSRSPEAETALVGLTARMAELEGRLTRFVRRALPVDPESEEAVEGQGRRAAVNARRNVEEIDPLEARYVRFTILASNGGEPCLDELEVYSGGTNVALAAAGATATASGTLPGYDIHQLAHLNDGRTGNRRSWISNEKGRGWVELDLGRTVRIDRVVWGRDREGEFGDRVAVRYRIDAARERGRWQLVAGSGDREPGVAVNGAGTDGPAAEYQFDEADPEAAEEGRGWLAEWERLSLEKKALSRPVMMYAGTFSEPGATHRLHRGDAMQKREVVAPGTLGLFQAVNMDADEPERDRRRKLADWIARTDHPLTARVMVNRLWQYHFGVGLVDTPNDFGRAGSAPTHPELLDWLASEFVRKRWSIKALQREILCSATWRQSAAPREDGLKVDAAGRMLWRFPPRRLEAEAIRDSILAVSGALDWVAGGPGFYLHDVDRENVYHYHPKDDFGPAEFRRMIYAFKVRMEQDRVFGAFDCPDGSLVVPRRSVSTTPLQALNLLNSPFVLQQAGLLARRLQREAGDEVPAQIDRAWRLAFGRVPSDDERRDARRLVEDHGLTALGRALMNANEMLFIP